MDFNDAIRKAAPPGVNMDVNQARQKAFEEQRDAILARKEADAQRSAKRSQILAELWEQDQEDRAAFKETLTTHETEIRALTAEQRAEITVAGKETPEMIRKHQQQMSDLRNRQYQEKEAAKPKSLSEQHRLADRILDYTEKRDNPSE